MNDPKVRLSCRVGANIARRVASQAERKRWSVQVWLEEAINEKLAYDEEIKSAAHKTT